MKTIFLSLLISLGASSAFGQAKCDVVNHYNDFFRMRIETEEGQHYRMKRTVKTGATACFPVTDSNIDYLDYLLSNFSKQENEKGLDEIKDSVTLQKTYITRLKKDSIFNGIMRELALKSVERKATRDTVTMNRLLNFAVKYFSVLKLDPKGNYVGKVCAGLNGITSTEAVRRPLVEAFCFSSVFRNYDGERFSMYKEFVKAIEELYKVNLGVDNKEKLLRAQGAVFMLMRNNENLKKMLLVEYEKNKDWLPFILKS